MNRMSAKGRTHMTCFASSGTGIPQSNVVREMERSSSGSRCKRARISLRHGSGLMNSGLLLMCSISRSWYLRRRVQRSVRRTRAAALRTSTA